MVFIEVQINEADAATEKVVADAYAYGWQEDPPTIRLGRVIVWKGRLFRELSVSSHSGLEGANKIFQCSMPKGRCRLLLGSFQGEVFVSPPVAGCDLAARVHEGGRCADEFTVVPFHYSSYGDDD